MCLINRKNLIIISFSIFIILSTSVNSYAQSLKIGGTGAALGGMQLLLEAFKKANPEINEEVLSSLGSGGGIKALKAKAIDIAVMSRDLKSKEQTDKIISHPYAKTAIVLATTLKNKTDAINSNDLLYILRGIKTEWKDGSTIRIVLRPDSETDVKLLRAYIPEIALIWKDLKNIPGIPLAYTDQAMADMILLSPGGLGLSTLALINSEKRPLKALILNGIKPSVNTIADGSYPLVKTLYYAINPENNDVTKKFIAFLHSDNGREILQKSGHYIPPQKGE